MSVSTPLEKAPDFLCLGVPKAGSTWLHNLLDEHPQIFLPEEIKEIHYFDRHFSRGQFWYSKFFEARQSHHKVAGDITPHYLYTNPENITPFKTLTKFIIIHRDPSDRCLSHYKFRVKLDNYKGSFEDFLDDYPHAIEWGMYGKYFAEFLKHYQRHQFLIISFTEAVRDVAYTKKILSEFLDIDVTLFPENAGKSVVNKTSTPRSPYLYKFAVLASKWMARANLFKFRNLVKNNALIGRLWKSSGEEMKVSISDDTLSKLSTLYFKDQLLFKTLIETKTA